MLKKDKSKWCWVDVTWGDAGIPCDTLQEAIDNYFLSEPDRKGETVVQIGHPNYYVPEVDAERVIEDIINYQIDDEIAEWSEDYLTAVRHEHTGYVVLETKSYPVDSNGKLIVV